MQYGVQHAAVCAATKQLMTLQLITSMRTQRFASASPCQPHLFPIYHTLIWCLRSPPYYHRSPQTQVFWLTWPASLPQVTGRHGKTTLDKRPPNRHGSTRRQPHGPFTGCAKLLDQPQPAHRFLLRYCVKKWWCCNSKCAPCHQADAPGQPSGGGPGSHLQTRCSPQVSFLSCRC